MACKWWTSLRSLIRCGAGHDYQRAECFSGCARQAHHHSVCATCGTVSDTLIMPGTVIQLSINLNKIALIRNSRDTRHPDPCEFATAVLQAGPTASPFTHAQTNDIFVATTALLWAMRRSPNRAREHRRS